MNLRPAIETTEVDAASTPLARREIQGRFGDRIDVSARLFLLVLILVLVLEVVAATVMVANSRRTWLLGRSVEARIAALAFDTASGRSVSEQETRILLDDIGVRAIAVERLGSRRLIGSSREGGADTRWVDLADEGMTASLAAGAELLFSDSSRSIWIVGQKLVGPAAARSTIDHRLSALGAVDAARISRVDVLVDVAALQKAIRELLAQLLATSLVMAVSVAGVVYLVVQRSVVRPVRRLAHDIGKFANDPEGIDHNVVPSRRRDEIGRAEAALAQMQWVLAGELRERRRLAGLGLSVSKINHELRNLLTTAQLLGDRLEGVADPVVQRVAPRLIATLDRAIRFCEATLAYGRATEPYPQRRHVPLAPLLQEMEDLAALGADARIRIEAHAEPDLAIYVDPEQFARALTNIVRNAVQALDAAGTQEVAPLVTIAARRDGDQVVILLADNGPGLPESARATLFAPFQGSMRAGGTGLGLAIASELVRLNGGTLDLDEGTSGACFRIVMPGKPAEALPT